MFTFPTEIHYGNNEVKKISKIVGHLGYRALLVASRQQIEQFKPIADIYDDLQKNNINVMLFDDIYPTSDSSAIDTAAAIARSAQCDFVIGIGGDIVLNFAKAIALVSTNPGDCSDYLSEQEGYKLRISHTPLPTVLVPIMPGSICEVTPGFIVRDKVDQQRKKLFNTISTPTCTIIDPEMTNIIPNKLLAPYMLMLLSYAVELFISKASNPISDTFALRTMELISNYIKPVLKEPGNMDHRLQIMIASLFISYGASCGKLGAIYSLSEAISSVNSRIFKGMTASLLLPQFMEFNLTASSGKYVQIAKILGEKVHDLSVLEAAIKAVEGIRKLVEECKIPSKLSELGFEQDDISEVVRAFKKLEETKHLPRQITSEELKTILDQSF